jgi:hypothetical protein
MKLFTNIFRVSRYRTARNRKQEAGKEKNKAPGEKERSCMIFNRRVSRGTENCIKADA